MVLAVLFLVAGDVSWPGQPQNVFSKIALYFFGVFDDRFINHALDQLVALRAPGKIGTVQGIGVEKKKPDQNQHHCTEPRELPVQ